MILDLSFLSSISLVDTSLNINRQKPLANALVMLGCAYDGLVGFSIGLGRKRLYIRILAVGEHANKNVHCDSLAALAVANGRGFRYGPIDFKLLSGFALNTYARIRILRKHLIII